MAVVVLQRARKPSRRLHFLQRAYPHPLPLRIPHLRGKSTWNKISLTVPGGCLKIIINEQETYGYPFIAGKGKAVPLQVWSGPEGSRKLRFPDFMTTAQDGGKVVSLTHRSPLPPGNTPGTHFCWRLCRPQGHSATGRIMSLKNSNETIVNRTRDLPAWFLT